jgi:Fuc2NAc and GlcNAc transferase
MQFIFYLVVFGLSAVSVRLYINFAKQRGLIDIPNQRSSHTIPTPRGGGSIFIIIWFLLLIVFFSLGKIKLLSFTFLFAPSLLIAFVSFLDDNINLSARWRFLTQICAVVIALLLIGSVPILNIGFIELTWQPLILLGLTIFSLWSINLFNFMDGTDGISSVEALFVLGGQSFFFIDKHNTTMAHLLWFLCAAILGFLLWNWPKAKVFMGDVGSASLGLLIALIAICLQKYEQVPIILSLMLYGVFLFDATLTLIRRLFHKEKWYEAHKSHAYQRVHQAGFSHLKLLLGVIIINIIIVILTLVAFYWPHLTLYMALLELLILCIIYFAIEQRQPMYLKNANI